MGTGLRFDVSCQYKYCEATDDLEDMAAHCASQEYRDRKAIEEMNEKIHQMSAMGFNVDEKSASPTATPKQKAMNEDSQSPTGNPYEFKMATDEDIEKTINAAASLIQKEQEYQAKKKRPKLVEPSSLIKRVHGRDDRVEKKLEGFYYERKRKKEQQTKAAEVEKDCLLLEKTKLHRFLSHEDKQMMSLIFELLKDKKLPIWIDSDMQDTVTLEDAITILNEGDVENTLIDGFTSMLARDNGLPTNAIYFKSTLWSLLKDEKNQIREKFLDDKLREVNDNLDNFEYLVFPMNSSGGIAATENNPYHWTLLVLDIQRGNWKHYNSMIPRRNSQDPFLNDATLMVDYISSFMQKLNQNKRIPSFTLLKTMSETIFAEGKNCTMITSEKTPQQKPGTIDCGIIVYYIIEKLAKAEAIPENLSKVEISEFRVSLLRRFLNDGDRSVAAKACRDHWAAEQPKAT